MKLSRPALRVPPSRRAGELTPHAANRLGFAYRSIRASPAARILAAFAARLPAVLDLVDQGVGGFDNDLTLHLKKVAAMVNGGLPTRLYYVNQGGYDTHAAQAGSQQLLLIYLSDAIHGFFKDLERIGRADDVAIMVFTEFGRRVNENASKGTDHGTATPMYILGKSVKGGFYGTFPSLTDLDDGNLKMTTDFRSVYGTMLGEWMGFDGNSRVLKGDYPTLGVFG
jgi:uncharacterized protein (DUF1501 family)